MIVAKEATPMWRNMIRIMAFAATGAASDPAGAWLIYPDRDDPARLIVEIERPYGDLVPFASLPGRFDTAVQTARGPEVLSYRWRYGKAADGLAFVQVDEDGRGTITFEFRGSELIDGQRLGAAAVLVAEDGTPLHTFYARTEVGSFAGGAQSHSVRLAIDRPPDWWRRLTGIAFFYMSYHPLQKLDDEGIWQAMRRAVGRFTDGQGTEQKG